MEDLPHSSELEQPATTFHENENEWNLAPLEDSHHSETNINVTVLQSQSLESSSIHLPWPAELHPAVSLGMRRVSSCYFSIPGSEATNSVADLLSLVDEHEHEHGHEHEHENKLEHQHDQTNDQQFNANRTGTAVRWNASEVLYHDIMMHVFTFIDISALAAFSQTALRPNFECFYFLQLQLQSSLLSTPNSLAGTECISRLAQLDPPAAQRIVQTYVDSNSSLHHMPLSHSLAYIRHVLERNGFQQHLPTAGSPSRALASAALLITLIGGAAVMGTTDNILPNMIKVGLAGGLVSVTAGGDPKNAMMRDTAERMARMIQELPNQLLDQLHSMQTKRDVGHIMAFPSSIATRIYGAFLSAYGPKEEEEQQAGLQQQEETSSIKQSRSLSVNHPISPNPYDNIQEPPCETLSTTITRPDKVPSGCVGAYSRVVQQATQKVISIIQQERKSNYANLPLDEQREVSHAFLDACSSDLSLTIVQDMVSIRKSVDVNGFHRGPDDNEMCALHTAAFHGACKVLEFLCQGLSNHGMDGGLANVNLRDANGWTALHFAAGANSVEAVRILALHGAELAVEANNGYTPFHWAQRLSNVQVVEELQKLGADQRFLLEHSLSSMAHRLFRRSRIQAA